MLFVLRQNDSQINLEQVYEGPSMKDIPGADNHSSINPTTGTRRWLRTIFKTAGALSILGGGGVVLHAILTHRERKRLRPAGRMIEVADGMMHMLATGTGAPTVILESGVGGYFGVWEWVQQEAGKYTRVISYDRAGLGFSEKSTGKRDAWSMARQLDEMLRNAGERPPYLLVGHSFGGLLVMAYAHLFPENTAGLVLVDPWHPNQTERSPEFQRQLRNFRNFFHAAAAASHLGVMRVTDLLSTMTEGLSGFERTRARMFFVSARHLTASARELDTWTETSDQMRPVHFGDLPILILSAAEPQVEWVNEFHVMHEEMLGLSTRANHRIIPGVEHLNFVTRQDNIRPIIRAILELIAAAKDPPEVQVSRSL
jgi:pimeloyl-ACP methyl ester carboxylesterase